MVPQAFRVGLTGNEINRAKTQLDAGDAHPLCEFTGQLSVEDEECYPPKRNTSEERFGRMFGKGEIAIRHLVKFCIALLTR